MCLLALSVWAVRLIRPEDSDDSGSASRPARSCRCCCPSGTHGLWLVVRAGSGAAASGTTSGPPPTVASLSGSAAEPATAVSAGSQGETNRYCASIKQSDAQALMKADVGPVVLYPLECSYAAGKILVNLYDDPGKTYYGVNAGASGHPLSGLGDEAIWYSAVVGLPPSVDAHQGTLTCSVAPPDDVSLTTLVTTGGSPSTTDLEAYARKVGALCADVFAVSG